MKFKIGDYVKILPNKGIRKVTAIRDGLYILDNNESRPYIELQLSIVEPSESKGIEMLISLGYSFIYFQDSLIYKGDGSTTMPDIYFNTKYKTCTLRVEASKDKYQTIEIDMALHQAIHQCLIDLEWS